MPDRKPVHVFKLDDHVKVKPEVEQYAGWFGKIAHIETTEAVALLRRFNAGTPPWYGIKDFLTHVDEAGFDL